MPVYFCAQQPPGAKLSSRIQFVQVGGDWVMGEEFFSVEKKLAERVRFELTEPFRAHTRSRRAPSTARPSLRNFLGNGLTHS